METIRVRRANVIVDISPAQKDYYMTKGYSVIDKATGKVLEEALMDDVNALKAKVRELQAENAKLREQLEAKLAEPEEEAPKAKPGRKPKEQ